MKYTLSSISRIGTRAVNEDNSKVIEDKHALLLVVADGMGGASGGKLASQVLVDTVAKVFHDLPKPVSDPQAFLGYAIMQAHESIIRQGRRHTPPLNPGTTCVVCLVQNGHAWWAHVGDSRLYLYRYGEKIFRTKDHSYVEYLLRSGEISKHDAANHPKRNQITRCVGNTIRPLEITYGEHKELLSGDVILLCSDGLWGGISDKEMGKRLQSDTLDNALSDMASAAEQACYPSSDNITAIAVRLLSSASPYEAVTPRQTEDASSAAPCKASAATEPVPQAAPDPLGQAIDDIQRAFAEYEQELLGEKSPRQQGSQATNHNKPPSAKEKQ